MEASALIKALLAQREAWCELEPGVRVKLRRPAEAELAQFFRGVGVEAVKAHAVDWEGITEAYLLGATVGAADAVPFTPALWAEVVGDRAAWIERCAAHLAELISQHLQAQAATAKNSEPSSTAPAPSSRAKRQP